MSLEELESYGLERMTAAEIRNFLQTQNAGVLGLVAPGEPYMLPAVGEPYMLPAVGEPYMLPISFGFDGQRRLYFTYLVGSNSRKDELTRECETAGFLVFEIASAFNWQSVLLRGGIEHLPEGEWDDVSELLDDAWNPDILERAKTEADVAVCEFTIREQTGVKHTGLPPGLR